MFCKDCDKLIQTVLDERSPKPEDCDVHCGFDSGQGMLKIAVTVTERNGDESVRGRSKYSQVLLINYYVLLIYLIPSFKGVAAKGNKFSSVNKSLVLSAIPDVPENYKNVEKILQELNMEAIEFTMSVDVKMRKFVIKFI